MKNENCSKTNSARAPIIWKKNISLDSLNEIYWVTKKVSDFLMGICISNNFSHVDTSNEFY